VKTVTISLAVLGTATIVQLAIYLASGSVALLADLVHNLGDALTAVPLGIAFFLRSFRGEKLAGVFVVVAIFVSACFAFVASVERLLHHQTLSHLGVLAAAGLVGFLGNEIAAQVRLRGGRRLRSPQTATTLGWMASCRSAWWLARSSSGSDCPSLTR
jgi:divalent metal cation (Fe/Co/Zn/Cd) transporter